MKIVHRPTLAGRKRSFGRRAALQTAARPAKQARIFKKAPNAVASSTNRLLFLVTEDWFMQSHFRHLIGHARASGFEPVVVCRVGGAPALGRDASAREQLERAGARIVPFDFGRGIGNPLRLMSQLAHLHRLFLSEQPRVVHAIALKPILLASLTVPVQTGLVLALTGFGFLATTRAMTMRGVAMALRRLVRARLRKGAVLVVENGSDAVALSLDESQLANNVVQVPGAGVELEALPVTEPPAEPPVKVGTIARLVRSKGIDVAVDAVAKLRAQGLNVELHIGGTPDPDNPAAVSADEIARWRNTAGITLHGWVGNVASFWAGMHMACFPSRGGEGLPRSLLEAAACGRALVASDVPGCRDCVTTTGGGLLVPPDDVAALAEALATLVKDRPARERFAVKARAGIARDYTTQRVADRMAEAWARASQG